MQGRSEVAVAVVSHNTREVLEACLRSIQRTNAAEVVVVDNASRDGSAEMVRSCFPDVHLRACTVNGGYGAGANQAVASCRARYVLLLNGDTQLQPGALQAIQAYLDMRPQVALLGPQLLNADGSPQLSAFPQPGPLFTLLRDSSLRKVAGAIPALRTRYLSLSPGPVSWVVGAAMAIRRDVFQAVHGFDESFFMYFEEVDLCRRLYAAGWEVHFAPVTSIVHIGGASTGKAGAQLKAHLYHSHLRYARRYLGRAQRALLWGVLLYLLSRNYVRDQWHFRHSDDPQKAAAIAGWQAAVRALFLSGGSR